MSDAEQQKNKIKWTHTHAQVLQKQTNEPQVSSLDGQKTCNKRPQTHTHCKAKSFSINSLTFKFQQLIYSGLLTTQLSELLLPARPSQSPQLSPFSVGKCTKLGQVPISGENKKLEQQLWCLSPFDMTGSHKNIRIYRFVSKTKE